MKAPTALFLAAAIGLAACSTTTHREGDASASATNAALTVHVVEATGAG